MKRCPQCEFIYEDDQSLCDMDGVLLVFDSRTLPNHHALATVPAYPKTPTAKSCRSRICDGDSRARSRQWFITSRPAKRCAADLLTRKLSQAPRTRRPYQFPRLRHNRRVSPTEEAPKEEPKPATTKQPAVAAPAKKPAAKTAPSPQPKPSTEAKKDESKVGSILKKTGRILKKPFKF